MMRRAWAMAILCAAVAPAGAGTFYVGPGGRNDADGTAPAKAWATLQHAVDRAEPGDAILLLEGTYAGARAGRSGRPDAWITIRPAPGAKVCLNAAGAGSRHSSILEFETWEGSGTVSCWRVEGLSIDASMKYGIDARHTWSMAFASNRVTRSQATGIFTAFSDDVRIEGNESAGNGEHGIYFCNSGDRFLIRGNRTHHNAACGIHLNGDASAGGDGVLADGVIEANVVYANGQRNHGGAGINMDGVTRSTVRNNILYDTRNNSGIALFQQDGAVASRDNLVAHNTVMMSPDGGWAVTVAHRECRDNRILNNILLTTSAWRGSVSFAGPGIPGVVSDGNCVVSRFSADGGATTVDITGWQSLGYDRRSILAPAGILFVSPLSNYRLKPGSPAINRGVSGAAVAADADGRPRDRPDIGAYEFVEPP